MRHLSVFRRIITVLHSTRRPFTHGTTIGMILSHHRQNGRKQPCISEDNACTREASEQPREEPCVHTVHRDTDREEPRHIDEPFANDTPHQAHACKEAVCEKDFSHNTCSKPSHAGFLGEDWILPLVLFLMLNNQGGGKLKQLLNFQDGEHTLLLLILAYVFFF